MRDIIFSKKNLGVLTTAATHIRTFTPIKNMILGAIEGERFTTISIPTNKNSQPNQNPVEKKNDKLIKYYFGRFDGPTKDKFQWREIDSLIL